MSVSLYLARRYLFDRRGGGWGAVTGVMATGSVALGVAALIITLAVMTGFREDIRARILGVQPHLIISGHDGFIDPDSPRLLETLAAHDAVAASSPYITGQVLIGHRRQTSGALLKGIVPAGEIRVAGLSEQLLQGAWATLDDRALDPDEKPGIVLGVELARNLGARVGDRVWLVTPGSIDMTALSVPRAHLFDVGGIVQTGLYDYDSTLAYLGLHEGRTLFDAPDRASGVGVRLRNIDAAETIARSLQVAFGGAYWVRSWLSLNRNLFSALKLEKAVMFIILTLVTVVASFMIVSNLLLVISHKVKEIGILRAMGATAGMIRRTFLLQGFLMGVVGNAIGVTLGVAISLILARTNFIRLPADVYYIDRLPVQLHAADILSVVAAATVIVLVATLYPADRAAKLDPVEAIRYG